MSLCWVSKYVVTIMSCFKLVTDWWGSFGSTENSCDCPTNWAFNYSDSYDLTFGNPGNLPPLTQTEVNFLEILFNNNALSDTFKYHARYNFVLLK